MVEARISFSLSSLKWPSHFPSISLSTFPSKSHDLCLMFVVLIENCDDRDQYRRNWKRQGGKIEVEGHRHQKKLI
jgi:hypothetical protein